jgi:outer membrane autotransporter protein
VGDGFRIVTAEGGIVGEFANLAQPEGLAAATRMEVYYNVANSNSIDLFVVPTSYSDYVQAREANENAVAIATSLDSLVEEKAVGATTTEEEALLYAVSAQSDTTLLATATALAGEVHGALAAAAPMANRWLTDSVGRELARDAAFGVEGGRGAWVDVGANRSDWRSDVVASGFDTTRTQVAIGWNLIGDGDSRLGVGFTYGKSDISAELGSGSVTHNLGFVYGQMALGRFVVDGLAAAGSSDWETDRPDPIAPLSALTTEVDGHDAVVAAGVRLPLNVARLALAPYARATWERISRDGFDEGPSSQSALSAGSYSASGTRLTAGLQGGSPDQRAQTAPFTWHFNFGVGRDAADLVQPEFDVSLAGLDTALGTPDVGRTFVFGEINATARIAGRLYGYFGVSGEARSGKSEDLGANLGVRMTF